MLQIKCTKNIDYFIVVLLPHLEQYLLNNPTRQITFHANEYICTIISIMFGNNIVTHQIKNGYDIINSPAIELDIFIKEELEMKEYITNEIRLSKPLQYGNNTYLKTKKFTCIFPKCQLSDPFHNMTHEMINNLDMHTNISKCDAKHSDRKVVASDSGSSRGTPESDLYIIGSVTERLNTKIGKEIDNFMDILDCFKYCKLFITSESIWKYIALLCNCRNIIVFNTPNHHVTGILENYKPFNNNVHYVTDMCCQNTYDLINTILDK